MSLRISVMMSGDTAFRAFTTSKKGTTFRDFDEVRAALAKSWERRARHRIKQQKRLAAYLQGMEIRQTTENTITLTLRGFDAVKTERGWLPPQTGGGSLADGLLDSPEQWDGNLHDMRPMLLWDAWAYSADSKRQKKHGGSRYRHIKMPVIGGIEEVMQEAANRADDAIRANMVAAKPRKGLAKAVDAGLDRLRTRLNTVWNKAIPEGEATKKRNRVGKEYTYNALFPPRKKEPDKTRHKLFLYSGVVAQSKDVGGGKRRRFLATFRTINDSHDQVDARMWFTRGVRPASVLDHVQDDLGAILQKYIEKLVTP